MKKLSGDWAYIDLFWPRVLIAEDKSSGKDLGKAHAQGMEYIRTLASSGRERDNPRYLIVSDFRRIAIHDLEREQDPDAPLHSRLPPSFEFPLQDFHKHIRHFFFIAGYKQHRLNPEAPANEEATQLMCDLYDALETGDYGTDDAGRAGHELKQFLVRLLFCLFAEDIRTDRSGRRRGRLAELQKKLAAVRFLDPACGCGNFLVITCRELRALKLDILTALHGEQQEMMLDDVNKLSLLDVDQMFGIEIEEFPARIAEVALWLADHQANVALGLAFTQAYLRIPLRKSPHIHVANALRLDWRTVLPPAQCSYILGNPPFIGHHTEARSKRRTWPPSGAM